jgi:hypothetical protein
VLRPETFTALALIALLASCQPLPRPFADDRPPAELLAIPESAGVSIAPVEGLPGPIAARLGAATARALLGRDIPASEKTAGHGSFQLYGQLIQSGQRGRSDVAILWRLEDARRRKIGEREVRVAGTADDWQSPDGAMIERLAALSADAVAALLVKETALVKEPAPSRLAALSPPISGRAEPDAAPASPPAKPPVREPLAAKGAVPDLASAKPAPAAPPADASPPRKRKSGLLRVAVRRVTGAPGDGGTSLAGAVTNVLRQQELTVIDPGGKADFYIDGEVSIAPVGPDKQHVKIVWRVRNASGAEIGTVGQENDVPRGLLSGSWGDVAHVVAAAASGGLVQVLAHAGPPAAPAAGDDAEAAISTEKAAGPKNPEGVAPAAKPEKAKGKR